MSPDRREILEQVARGELTPEDADELLRGLDREPSPVASDSGVRSNIRKIRVSVGVGGIDIVGDPEVAAAEIEGPHEAEIPDAAAGKGRSGSGPASWGSATSTSRGYASA
jgi:hypothetical protein